MEFKNDVVFSDVHGYYVPSHLDRNTIKLKAMLYLLHLKIFILSDKQMKILKDR